MNMLWWASPWMHIFRTGMKMIVTCFPFYVMLWMKFTDVSSDMPLLFRDSSRPCVYFETSGKSVNQWSALPELVNALACCGNKTHRSMSKNVNLIKNIEHISKTFSSSDYVERLDVEEISRERWLRVILRQPPKKTIFRILRKCHCDYWKEKLTKKSTNVINYTSFWPNLQLTNFEE